MDVLFEIIAVVYLGFQQRVTGSAAGAADGAGSHRVDRRAAVDLSRAPGGSTLRLLGLIVRGFILRPLIFGTSQIQGI